MRWWIQVRIGCAFPSMATQLKLEGTHNREVTLADGKEVSVPYVGPLQIMFEK